EEDAEQRQRVRESPDLVADVIPRCRRRNSGRFDRGGDGRGGFGGLHRHARFGAAFAFRIAALHWNIDSGVDIPTPAAENLGPTNDVAAGFTRPTRAKVAELVDALVSGASG